MKKDVVGLIALMRSGRVPLIPPEEAFLSKVDKLEDSSDLKLTKKDDKALTSFLNRVRLGLGNEDDAETEVEDPDDHRIIIVPGIPAELPGEYEPRQTFIPKPRAKELELPLPSRAYKKLKMGRARPDDIETEVGDPDDYTIVIVPEYPIRVPQPQEADRAGVRGLLI